MTRIGRAPGDDMARKDLDGQSPPALGAETGRIEVETLTGSRRGFRTGDILCLVGLALRALHNPGPEPTVLMAVSRRGSAKNA